MTNIKVVKELYEKPGENRRFIQAGFLTIVIILNVFAACSMDMDKGPEIKNELTDFFPQSEGLNVLIVSFDALRADALGTYGYTRRTSPNIDRFSAGALVFERAHSASHCTPTSFAAAFTGKLPFRSFRGWKMIKGQTTAGIFQKAGYRTVFISDNVQLVKKRRFHQGFDHFEVLLSCRDHIMLPKTLEMLEKICNERFFAWFHFLSPHTPYDRREIARIFYDREYNGRFKRSVPGKYKLESDEEIKYVRDFYDGEVFFADFIFQQLLEKINELGLQDKTIIILTSDHGEEFLEHGGTGHDNLFEEVTRVPFIIKHPKVNISARANIPFSNVDILPTLASLLKIPYKKSIDGVDLSSGDYSSRVKVAVKMNVLKEIGFSIYRDRYKLLYMCNPKRKVFLYDLTLDPAERTNLSSQKPIIRKKMMHELLAITGGDPCKAIRKAIKGGSPQKGLSKKQIKKLKTLGYFD